MRHFTSSIITALLGLSIAYWIVDTHGGRIEVDSHDGQGTTFCVYLPLQQPDPAKE